MNANELLAALSRKIGSGKRKDLAQFLGVSQMALYNWERKKKPLTPNQIANAVVKAERAAFKRARTQVLRPIAEFFPLEVTRSRQGIKFELFATDDTSSAYRTGLRKVLQTTRGVYLFYDSRGRALYAGKAKQQPLWREMKNAFNRDRDTQKLYRVRHPKGNVQFSTATVQGRQPRVTEIQLNELAKYFSAYQVDDDMINEVEAMLVRGFANDLLNKKMERFQHARVGTRGKPKAARQR